MSSKSRGGGLIFTDVKLMEIVRCFCDLCGKEIEKSYHGSNSFNYHHLHDIDYVGELCDKHLSEYHRYLQSCKFSWMEKKGLLDKPKRLKTMKDAINIIIDQRKIAEFNGKI